MAQYVRMQMLYRPDQREALRKYAREQNVSVTEAARRALDIGLTKLVEEDEFTRRKRALEDMAELRAEILARNNGVPLDVDVAEDLRQMREERIEQITGDH
jgi:Zn-dependent peptidase ImmA (M78 family)